MVSSRLGFRLKNVLGRNSPVKTTIIVERIVSRITCVAVSMPLNMVLLNISAKIIPYNTRTILFPTSMVDTKPLGLR